MIAFVTGVTGFVGPHVVRALRAEGHEVRGSGLEAAPPAKLGGDAALSRYAAWDLGAGPAAGVPLLAGADLVVHLAGQASAARSYADPAGTFRANVAGTQALFDALRTAGSAARVLVVSSSEVYAPVASADPISEDAPTGPISPYGASKLAAEAIAHAAVAANERAVVIARSFSHTGEGQGDAFALASWARQVAGFEAQAARGEAGPFRIAVGNLAPVRDYSDVRDVARAYALLVAQGRSGATYNVCSGRGIALSDALGMLVARARVPVTVWEDPARHRPADLPFVVGDAGRLRALGFAPRHAFAETLDALLDGARREIGAMAGGT